MIVADVQPDARIAQEEIFGPVLAVLRARDLDDALAIANGTEYALTGGLYSRSPANIERVKREFRVGNLYINRPITGALVDRQPFGGFKLSGIGTKAGGPDYLREFLLTRTVTENTMRRGFAPSRRPRRPPGVRRRLNPPAFRATGHHPRCAPPRVFDHVADADPGLIQHTHSSPVAIQVKFARTIIAVISKTNCSTSESGGSSPRSRA